MDLKRLTKGSFLFLVLQFPDPRVMQINLTGFLEKRTPEFMKDLWTMLLSAQEGTGGIPQEILEKKKRELLQKREEEELISKRIRDAETEARKRKEEEEQRKVNFLYYFLTFFFLLLFFFVLPDFCLPLAGHPEGSKCASKASCRRGSVG